MITTRKYLIFIGFACAITLASLGLMAYQTKARCFSQFGSIDVHDCPPQWAENCSGAYAIYGAGATYGTHFNFYYRCPWSKPTSILGLIGLSLGIIFLAAFIVASRMRKGSRIPLTGIGALSIITLVACLAMTIKDLKNGFDTKNEEESDSGYKPGLYLVNAALVLLGLAMISPITIKGYRLEKNAAPKLEAAKGSMNQIDAKIAVQEFKDSDSPKGSEHHSAAESEAQSPIEQV